MDTTKTITHIGLCAGYGGIELGLGRVIPTLRSVALCEIEAFPIANLVAKMEAGLMDPAPVWTDLKSFPWESFRDRVDILTGGYPCQPFSAAGKRAGKDDPRHLWPWIADGIRILRPRVCFFENVEGHISLGLREVIGELESIGYQVSWGIFSAREVGAPHQRKRVFILAYLECEGLEGLNKWHTSSEQTESVGADFRSSGQRSAWEGFELADTSNGTDRQSGGADADAWPSRPGEPQHAWEPPRVVGNATSERSCGGTQDGLGLQSEMLGKGYEAMGNANGPRPQEWTRQRGAGIQGTYADGGANAERQTQPSLGRSFNESPDRLDYAELYTTCDNRTDELRLLGNGVVPATAERAFRTLMKDLI